MKNNIESNIKKYFYFLLTHRRNFIPILSIYFLSLHDATANQIGIYSGIGYLASFLFNIPSGYFADNFGHKKALIISKVLLMSSTILYILGGYFGNAFYFFVVASIFFSLGFSFTNGVGTAFFHETLMKLGKDKHYAKIMGKLKGNVSLASMVLIILIPFTSNISLYVPLFIGLFLDIIGLFISFSLVEPKGKHFIIEKENKKSLKKLFKEYFKIGLLPFSIFTGAITGFMIADSAFRNVYLEDLGYPIVLIGLVMGISRGVWFIVGHFAHHMEKYFTMKQHFIFEILIFVGYYFAVVIFNNPYVVGIVFSIVVGYQWGRSSVIQHYLLNNYDINKNYKASILSIHGQLSYIFQVGLSFFIGYFMSQSFKLGYFILGIILFFVLLVSYFFIFKEKVFCNCKKS